MTLRNLKIFLAVADCGSMSEAAKQMSIAQPSVSGTVGEIEDFYGVRLFERLGRRLYITPTGVQLAQYARHILSMYDTMEYALKNANETVALRVGATVTVGTCVLGDVLDRFNMQNDCEAPRVVVDNTQVIEDKLVKSELDVGLIEGTIRSRDLVTRVVMPDPLVLVASAKANPLAGRSEVYLEDLEELPFVLREEGSGTRELFVNEMAHINIQWVCNNSEAIIRAVERGYGLTVISRRLVKEQLERGSLVEIPVRNATFERQFSVVWHKNKFLSKPLSAFISVCSSYGQDVVSKRIAR